MDSKQGRTNNPSATSNPGQPIADTRLSSTCMQALVAAAP